MFKVRRFGVGVVIALFVTPLAIGCAKKEKEMRRPGAAVEQTAPTSGGTAASATGTASVAGKVAFAGKAPVLKPLKVQGDPVCEKTHKTVKSEDVVINANGTLKNVIVYVKSGISSSYSPPGGAAELDQVGCVYTPHVLAVQTGQMINIKNGDATTHNVHAMPTVNQQFNQAMPPGLPPMQKSFTDAEGTPVKFKCDVHPWMSAFVGVFNHPFFAVTGDDGSFTLRNLPAGKYTIAAWHEMYGEKTMEVQVTDGQAATQDLSLGG